MKHYITIDIGGSHLTAGVVGRHDGRSRILSITHHPMNSHLSAREFIRFLTQSIVSVIKQAGSQAVPEGVGISLPGPFEYRKGVCRFEGVNKFDSLFGLDITSSLQSSLVQAGFPADKITFINDAQAFLLGMLYQYNLHGENLLALTIGTGVGSASYSQGKLYPGFLDEEYLYCRRFREGRAEDYFSTKWFLDQASEIRSGRDTVISGVKELAELASERHEAAEIFTRFGKNLAEFINELTRHKKAGRILFGGKIFRSFHLFENSFRNHLAAKTEIQIADNTSELALLGAAGDHLNKRSAESPRVRDVIITPFPVCKSDHQPDGYDIYPAYSLDSGQVRAGYRSLVLDIKNKTSGRVVIDGNVGTNWTEVVQEISREFTLEGRQVTWYCVDAALKPKEKTQAMLNRYLGGDDPLFGYQYPGELVDFFEPNLLKKLSAAGNERSQSVKENNMSDSRLSILYGTGAALAGWDAPLIYIDIPKKEIQTRSREGTITNLGGLVPGDAGAMYKQFYFIDWPVCNKHKQTFLPRMAAIADGQRPGTITWMKGDDFRAGLDKIVRTPFRVRPVFEPGVWGGQWMKNNFAGLNPDAKNYAWSYEVISPENGIIFESDHLMMEAGFEFILYHNNEALLGRDAEKYGYYFPIRFNHLDTMEGENLSLQCHPTEPYIREHFGELITQDETYYMMDTMPGSVVYFGFREEIDAEEFKSVFTASAKNGEKVDVEKYVQTFPGKKHDLYLIPAGTIHSSGKNNLVLEISNTPYNFTFKIYDWQRLDLNGKPRPLNTERAFDNLDFSRKGDLVGREYISKPVLAEEGDGWKVLDLPTHEKHLYAIRRVEFEKPVRFETDNKFQVLNLVEGNAVRVVMNDYEVRLNYAETVIIPAATGSYRLENESEGTAKIVKAFMK